MPFKSEKQRRYLWKFHPDVAKRWAEEAETGKKAKHKAFKSWKYNKGKK